MNVGYHRVVKRCGLPRPGRYSVHHGELYGLFGKICPGTPVHTHRQIYYSPWNFLRILIWSQLLLHRCSCLTWVAITLQLTCLLPPILTKYFLLIFFLLCYNNYSQPPQWSSQFVFFLAPIGGPFSPNNGSIFFLHK